MPDKTVVSMFRWFYNRPCGYDLKTAISAPNSAVT